MMVWMRASAPALSVPSTSDFNSNHLHHCVAAFASDWMLGNAMIRPHALQFPNPRIQLMTSLDHAMWFHAPFKADQWMLYVMDSPALSNQRGINMGRVYTQDGTLAVSVAQEALIRLNE
jgi:acyl-CoA thioesterase-2